MTDGPKVAAARSEVERSRARLMSTAQELQERLSPKTLARGAWEGAKMKGADIAEDAVDAVRSRPYATGGVMAAIAMFLARDPIRDLAGKLVDGMSKKRTTRKALRKPTSKGKEAPAKHNETEAAE